MHLDKLSQGPQPYQFPCSLLRIYQFGFVDAMATEEWKKEVQKHEEYIKNLEDKYKKKCLDIGVLGTLLSEALSMTL